MPDPRPLIPAFPSPSLPPTWAAPPEGWEGVRVRSQAEADELVPDLLRRPASLRYVVVEPTGPVNLESMSVGDWPDSWLNALVGARGTLHTWANLGDRRVVWLIVAGGEVPIHPEWVRSLREQAKSWSACFTFAGWGKYAPVTEVPEVIEARGRNRVPSMAGWPFGLEAGMYVDLGPSLSGRLLDGATHESRPGGPTP